MRKGRVKTSWAAVSMGNEGQPVVCYQVNGTPRCLHFTDGEHLARVVQEGGLTVGKWIVAVPAEQCILKTLRLPAGDLREAAQMAGFELPALVPLPREELTYGCSLLRQHEKGMDVLLWILKLDVLQRCLTLYRTLGVEPQVTLPDVLAIRAWFAARTAGHPLASVVDVLAAAQTTTVIVSQEGLVQTGRQLSESEEGEDGAIWETVLVSASAGPESPEGPAPRILVSFSGDAERAARIRNALGVLPQADRYEWNMVEAAAAVTYPQDDEPPKPCTECCQEAVIAEGLLRSLSHPHLEQINLLPETYAVSRRRWARWRGYGLLFGLLVLVLLLLWSLLVARNLRLKRQCELVRSEIAPIQDTAAAVAGKRHRLQAIQHQIADRGQLVLLIQELYRYTPTTISFYELTFSRQPEAALVEIKGQADSLPTALEYTDAVREAKLLAGLQILNAQQIPSPGGGVVEFKATCTLRGDHR